MRLCRKIPKQPGTERIVCGAEIRFRAFIVACTNIAPNLPQTRCYKVVSHPGQNKKTLVRERARRLYILLHVLIVVLLHHLIYA